MLRSPCGEELKAAAQREKALTGLPNEGDMGEDSAKGVETGSGVEQPWMPHPEWD